MTFIHSEKTTNTDFASGLMKIFSSVTRTFQNMGSHLFLRNSSPEDQEKILRANTYREEARRRVDGLLR